MDYLAQPKLKTNKFMSLAEVINKLTYGTPERFRTKSKKDIIACTNKFKLRCTVAESPMLATKKRIRPTNAISREDMEKAEFEEAKK